MPSQLLTLYSPCVTIDTGCILYTASTMAIGTEAPNGYYSLNGDCFRVTSPRGQKTGLITSKNPCPAPTVYTFLVYNDSTTATITEIGVATGAAFFVGVQGTLPIIPGDHIFGNGTTSSAVYVRIINGTMPIKQSLYRNDILLQCITLAGNNAHYFNSFPFGPGDVMKITIEDGTC